MKRHSSQSHTGARGDDARVGRHLQAGDEAVDRAGEDEVVRLPVRRVRVVVKEEPDDVGREPVGERRGEAERDQARR